MPVGQRIAHPVVVVNGDGRPVQVACYCEGELHD